MIWCPRELKLASRWHKDGPELPVEFSRVSQDGRLTLVIVPGAKPQRTLWALSSCSSIAEAKENLRQREGKPQPKHIHAWESGDVLNDDQTIHAVSTWARSKNLSSAIWTDLPAKDSSGSERVMTVDESISYLSNLSKIPKQKAEEYIRAAPSQIATEIRKAASKKFGWTDYILSEQLFED